MNQNITESYEQKCQVLSEQAKVILSTHPQSVGLDKKTSNLFRQQSRRQSKLDVSNLNSIIHINTEHQFLDVEGMTTYEDIVNATLPYGLIPTVIPELKTITIGGALAGIGIESSSFRYGLVHETVLEFDMLMPDGQIITCTPHNEHANLFFAFPNLYATLGYATRVRVMLQKIKPYIHLQHIRYHTIEEAINALQYHCTAHKADFIDGVAFCANEIYVTLATLTDDAPYTSDYTYLDTTISQIINN